MSNLEKFFAGLVILLTYALIVSLGVRFLWNYSLAPAIDGVNSINYLQAFGIIALCIILFKSPTINSKKDE